MADPRFIGYQCDDEVIPRNKTMLEYKLSLIKGSSKECLIDYFTFVLDTYKSGNRNIIINNSKKIFIDYLIEKIPVKYILDIVIHNEHGNLPGNPKLMTLICNVFHKKVVNFVPEIIYTIEKCLNILGQ